MLKNRSGRTGFTLPEVLVTVAIVAVLAAVVVPTVTSQIGKGDDTNLQTNVETVRTAITAFVSDVRKYPGRLFELASQPATTDSDVFNNQFNGVQTRWKGPYQTTGQKGKLDSVRYGGLGYALDGLVDTTMASSPRGLVLTLSSVPSTAAALHIDSLLDNGDSTTGNVQFSSGGSATFTKRVKVLLMSDK